MNQPNNDATNNNDPNPNAVPDVEGGADLYTAHNQSPPPDTHEDEEGEEIVLSAKQYNEVLDYVASLEQLNEQLQKNGQVPKARTVDDLADEINQPPPKQAPKQTSDQTPDINKMDNRQLTNFIYGQVNEQVATPLLVKVEELRLQLAEKDLRLELAKADGDDFDSYKEQMYQICTQNPQLSLRDAYYLAKRNNPKPKKEDEPRSPTPPKHLPPRKSPVSERDGHPKSLTRKGDPNTRKSAAERALEDMEKEGKI